GLAIALGTFLERTAGGLVEASPVAWGSAAIIFFVLVNLVGVRWGGRAQGLLTGVKVTGIAGLGFGGLGVASPSAPPSPSIAAVASGGGLSGFVRFTGLGIAAVLFTYDGWTDVTHVAGEVRRPARDFPIGLGLGVAALTLLYLVVNMAFLRVVPLPAMR